MIPDNQLARGIQYETVRGLEVEPLMGGQALATNREFRGVESPYTKYVLNFVFQKKNFAPILMNSFFHTFHMISREKKLSKKFSSKFFYQKYIYKKYKMTIIPVHNTVTIIAVRNDTNVKLITQKFEIYVYKVRQMSLQCCT